LVREPEESTVIRTRRGARPLRDLVVVALAAAIPAIAGCEAGNGAPTQQWHQPTPGASAIVNNTIRINNMFVLGPAPGFTLPAGATAGVFFSIANDGAPDRLVSISAPRAAAAVHVPVGGISLSRKQSLFLTGPSPRVLLVRLTRGLHGGQAVRVNMRFQNAGRVSLLVPVMPRAAYYGTYSPAPLFLRPSGTAAPLIPFSPSPAPTP
jgi:copper(I)-binding protein